jgi:hypothetical protein
MTKDRAKVVPIGGTRVPIDAVQVDARARETVGDVSTLAASIGRLGLLHPIAVTDELRLVAGERRLAACRSLGWAEVPVTYVHGLDDATLLLIAERDENTERVAMTPAEKVALGRRLEELERPKAAERQTAPTELRKNFPKSAKGKTYDKVGQAVGMSGPTYKRAKAVVDAAASDDAHPEAIAALEQMQDTGKVTPAYNRLREAQPEDRRHGNQHGVTDDGKWQRKSRDTRKVENATDGLRALAHHVGAAVRSVNPLLDLLTPDEATTWNNLLDECGKHVRAGKTAIRNRERNPRA